MVLIGHMINLASAVKHPTANLCIHSHSLVGGQDDVLVGKHRVILGACCTVVRLHLQHHALINVLLKLILTLNNQSTFALGAASRLDKEN